MSKLSLQQLLLSYDYMESLQSAIKQLKDSYGKTDWRKIFDDETVYSLEDGSNISIQLVPEWGSLEVIDCQDPVELYNDYNDSHITSESEIDWTKLDIKVRLLDHDNMMDSTLQVYYLDNGEVKTLY